MSLYYPSKQEFIALSRKGNLIPVYKEVLADTLTPVSAFLHLQTDPYAFLLESVEGGERLGRYSFLGSRPSRVLRTSGRDPLKEVAAQMSRYRFVPVKGLPRFTGGMVGYLGYDVVRYFEKLPNCRADVLKVPEAVFMLADTMVIFDHLDRKIKIVSHAHVQKNAAAAYEAALEKIDELERRLSIPPAPRRRREKIPAAGIVRSNMTKARFSRIVNMAKRYIRRGDIIQVVLSQRFQRDLTAEPFDVYRILRSLNPSPYLFYLKLDDIVLTGSSPELLVRCEEGRVETRPIAGTRPRGRNEEEDHKLAEELLADPKERAEHIMLVDLGRNDLGRVCKKGSVRIKDFMIIEKYSHVMHIVTGVTGVLDKKYTPYDLLRAAFPAGTVTGAPKIRAMEIIEELEESRRGTYAGAVGYFSFSGNMDTCITIRSILIKKGQAYVQAGAGIVADSVPSREYQESVNKAKALIKALEAAEESSLRASVSERSNLK